MSDTTLTNGEKRAVNPLANGQNGPAFDNTRAPSTESGKPEDSRLENGEGLPAIEPVDPKTEKKIMTKLDKRIVPMIMWVYLMNMMDRGESLCTPCIGELQ